MGYCLGIYLKISSCTEDPSDHTPDDKTSDIPALLHHLLQCSHHPVHQVNTQSIAGLRSVHTGRESIYFLPNVNIKVYDSPQDCNFVIFFSQILYGYVILITKSLAIFPCIF